MFSLSAGLALRLSRGLGRSYSRLSSGELVSLAIRESFRAIRDPYLRGDSVAAVGEATGQAALAAMRERMLLDSEGRAILRDRPLFRADQVDFAALGTLPASTLGGAFARYMSMHGFQFGERPQVKLIHDEEMAFVMQRYRDTHDILHALCGAPVSVTGEIALKWFEMVQTGLPMTAFAALFGIIRAESTSLMSAGKNHKASEDVLQSYINWCCRAGRKSKFFLNVYFEKHWEEDLVQFRRRMNLPTLPRHLPSLDAAWDETRVDCMRKHYEEALRALDGDADERRKEPFLTYLDALKNIQ